MIWWISTNSSRGTSGFPHTHNLGNNGFLFAGTFRIGVRKGLCDNKTIFRLSSSSPRLEFVTGRTGPRKTRAPGPFLRPAPLNGLGRGVFFGIPCPCASSGPRPTHTPDGSPSKMCGNKRGPVQGMSAGGPRAGAGRGLP